jgi:hypothetical protein
MSSSVIYLVILFVGSLSAMQLLKAEPRFSYDLRSSKCIDSEGKEGLNIFDPEILFKGISTEARGVEWPPRVAQCTDFSAVKFHDYLGVNYNVLSGWDFRGSIFTGAELSFNFIDKGLFVGSNIELIAIGYGRIRAADRPFDQGDMPMPIAAQVSEP